MYLLYLDDSGSVGNTKEEYFVLGGFCIPETSIYWLSKRMETLASRIDREDPSRVEFHASEIFSGREYPWDQYRVKEDRVNFIKQPLLVLKDAYPNIVAFACAVHKASFPQHDPVKMAFEDLCSRFDMYLNRIFHDDTDNEHKGMIIFDKSAYENILQRMAIDFRKQGTRWGELKDIIEVPLFVDSKASRLIQMADHIAYSVFRRYDANDLTYINIIESKFDMCDGRIHGLVHKQSFNRNCTCPACLTRPTRNR